MMKRENVKYVKHFILEMTLLFNQFQGNSSIIKIASCKLLKLPGLQV